MIVFQRSRRFKIKLLIFCTVVLVVICFVCNIFVIVKLQNQNQVRISDQKASKSHSSFIKIFDSFNNNNNKHNKKKSYIYNYTAIELKQLNSVTTEDFINGDELTQSFFTKYFNHLINNRLSFPLKRRMNLDDQHKPFIDDVHFHKDPNEVLSEEFLLNYFDFPEDFVQDLTEKHANIVANLPNFVPKFYNGDGYVIVGGGKYSWYSLVAVQCLRKVGAILPVEVILPNIDDYEPLLCEIYLPSLNAKCIQAEKIFGKEILNKINISGYQLKSLALLASSFTNTFLLDSDSYVISNPEHLFSSELYKQKHMITWPDFWRRTTSPIFYKITGTKISDKKERNLNDIFTDIYSMNLNLNYSEIFNVTKDISFHDRGNTILDWSTESGEMLINKNIHFNTLLLAFYYNFDGPFGYHPLLSQGGAGEGDKETFVAAATYLKLPYYQVFKAANGAFGFYNYYHSFEHGAIIQYDPVTDFQNVNQVRKQIKHDILIEKSNFIYDYEKYFINGIKIEDSKPLFYHCHDPKFDPYKLAEQKYMFVVEEDGNKTNRRRRILGDDFPRGEIDLELELWEIADHYICKKEMQFAIFEEKNRDVLCEDFIPEQLKFLRESGVFIRENYNPNTPMENLEGSNTLLNT